MMLEDQKIYDLKTQIYENEEKDKELCSMILKKDFDESISFLENIHKLQLNKNRLGVLHPLLDSKFYFFIIENATKIMSIIEHVQKTSTMYQLTYFGLETLRNKYLLTTHTKYQESIDFFFVRVALYIWQDNLTNFEIMYRNMREGKFIPATPTLFNSGCVNSQLASCFLLGNSDSIEGIFDSVKECAKISKLSGGIGLHVHNIRANGSYIYGTNGTSNGLVPMLRVYNDVARYVDQGGGKRNGSFAIYLEPWHADIFSFLNLKKNIGTEEVRARDLFYALWIPNLFMEKIMKNEDWYLMNPSTCPNLSKVHGLEFENLYHHYVQSEMYEQKIKARDLWVEICRMQIETGSPYILYKDHCNQLSNQKNLGTIQSSNLCCEIVEYSDENEIAVCNLSSIALPKFLERNQKMDSLTDLIVITKENCSYCLLAKYFLQKHNISYQEYDQQSTYVNEQDLSITSFPHIISHGKHLGGFQELWFQYLQPIFNFEKLGEIVQHVTENLNEVIEKNKYPLDKCKHSNLKHRPIGIGVQGLADVFHQLLISYDSDQAKQLNRMIFETLYYFSLKQSCMIAKEKGPYSSFPNSPISQGQFHFDLYDREHQYPYEFTYDWSALREEIKTHGTRNSLLCALMPTASSSQILANTESFEPLTSNFYVRRTLNGEFYVINRLLQNILRGIGIWNQDLKDKMIYYKGSIQQIKEIPIFLKQVFKTVWEISPKNLIDMSADRGYFIDQSQSFNIYLENPTIKMLNQIHFYGYKRMLKTGSYYVRTRAITSGQNFYLSSEKEQELECDNCSS